MGGCRDLKPFTLQLLVYFFLQSLNSLFYLAACPWKNDEESVAALVDDNQNDHLSSDYLALHRFVPSMAEQTRVSVTLKARPSSLSSSVCTAKLDSRGCDLIAWSTISPK